MTDLHSPAEKNARIAARGEYTRWLARRFGGSDLMTTKEGGDKVALSNIYVPLRLDQKDRLDEDMVGPDQVKGEKLSGQDARDVIADHRFVAISGRPGSGKTTLAQALISELCAGEPSEFRIQMTGQRGILPVPLTLREYQNDLPDLASFSELLERWWRLVTSEAKDKGVALDIERLRQSVAPQGDGLPMLLIFDGIDEVGGTVSRNKVVAFAHEALEAGHRVVLTGRPAGFQGIDLLDDPREALKANKKRQRQAATSDEMAKALFESNLLYEHLDGVLYHVQPFTWPQIESFLKRFYLLRDEWKVERERGLADIEAALTSRERAHLLTLARRPIFLTLMALVHVNDRRMPDGRAGLYRRIIDLYLIRQTQQRRQAYFTRTGQPMPHWDEREVRRALGYVAWRSQRRAEKIAGARERDKRQVIWKRRELLATLTELLGNTLNDIGQYRELCPTDAEELLDYYLHPAGLLIEPAEGRIQFAHLSFQEYLCAEYLHGIAVARGSRRFLDETRRLVLDHLHKPGWDEIGLLFLTIHAQQGAQAQGSAHLEVLAELDIARLAEARLLAAALIGSELDFDPAEQRRWLPLALGAALLHSASTIAERFGSVEAWTDAGLALVKGLLQANDPWTELQRRFEANLPSVREPDEWRQAGLYGPSERRWRAPKDDASWNVDEAFGPDDARASALLITLHSAAWGMDVQDARNPIRDAGLDACLAEWLATNNLSLYHRGAEDLPEPTYACLALDALLPSRGATWTEATRRLPLDAWLLQGEAINVGIGYANSQAGVLLSLYPQEKLSGTLVRLSLVAYQFQLLTETLAEGQGFVDFSRMRSRLRVQSLLLFRLPAQFPTMTMPRALSQSMSRSKSLSWSWHRPKTKPRPRPRSLSQALSGATLLTLRLVWPELRSLTLSPLLNILLEKLTPVHDKLLDADLAKLMPALELFSYRYAALDWFAEQAESPELMHARGLRPSQPIPDEFGLFDATGQVSPRWPRAAIGNIRAWLENDDNLLAWTFPEGLAPCDEAELRVQLAKLRRQPWSLQKAFDAVLADWPIDVPWRDMTQEAIESPLIAICEAILIELDKPKPRSKAKK